MHAGLRAALFSGDLYPGASVALDFLRNSYKAPGARASSFLGLPGATFTRASVGTAEDSAGNVVNFPSGAPRITDKGLLIEESRTNKIDFSIPDANWTKSPGGTGSTPTITTGAGLAPDGSMTASRVQLALNGGTTAADFSQISRNCGYTISVTETGSFWVKSNTGSTYAMTIVNPDGVVNTVISVTPTWKRFSSVSTGSSTTTGPLRLRLRGSEGSSDNVDVLVWHSQCEDGAFMTTTIPTSGAAATRAADDCALILPTSVAAPFTAWFEGLTPFGVSTDARMTLSDGNTNNRVWWAHNGTLLNPGVVAGGSATYAPTATALGLGVPIKAAISFDGANYQSGVNGVAAPSGAAALVPGLVRIDLGKNAGGSNRYWNNYIKRFVIEGSAKAVASLTS